jgi:hypothetical protein
MPCEWQKETAAEMCPAHCVRQWIDALPKMVRSVGLGRSLGVVALACGYWVARPEGGECRRHLTRLLNIGSEVSKSQCVSANRGQSASLAPPITAKTGCLIPWASC